ncbi:hypothetical protein Tco_1060437 [Tanacetum coccineum]
MAQSPYQTHQNSYQNSQFQPQVSLYQSRQYGSPFQSQQYSNNQSSTPLSITYPSNDYQSSVHHNVYSPPSSIPQLEYAPTVNQQPEFPQLDSGLIVPVFQKGDDPIDAINHMMSFLTAVVTSRYPSTNNQLRNSSNPRQQATIINGRVTLQPVQGRQTSFDAGTTRTYTLGASGDTRNSKSRPLRTVITQNVLIKIMHLDEYELIVMKLTCKVDLLVRIYIIMMSDALALSVNDTPTAELERYKEQVKVLKEEQNINLRSNDNISDSNAQSVEIDRLKQTLSEHLKEKESLMKSNSVNSPEPTLSSRPTKVEVPKELPKVSMVNTSLKKLKHHLAGFDVVVKERTTATAITEGSWGFEHTKACFRDEIIPFVKALKDLFNTFDQYLIDELSEVQNVFHQMEQAVEQHRLESKTFEVKMNQVLNENERLLEQVISKDIVNIIVNSSVDNTYENVHECEKCLKLETELQKDFVEKEIYDKLFKSFTTLEKHCISLEVDTQLNQEIFQRDNSVSNQSAPSFDQLFELNELKAQSQEKDTVIKKLKERIKSLSGKMNEDKIKKDLEEIETINIELDHRVSKLIAENEHLKQTYKQLYDSIKPACIRSKEQCDDLINQVNLKSVEISDLNASLQEKVLLITALKDDLRKLKGKALVDNHSKLNANSKLKCVKCKGCMLSDNHDLCVLDFINNVKARVKSKSAKKNSKRKVWKPTRKVFTNIRYIWRPTGQTFIIVGNVCPLTRITTTTEVPLSKPIALVNETPKPVVTLVYSRKPRKSKTNVPVSKSKVLKSVSANKKEPSQSWGSIVSDVPSSSLDECRSSKLFSGTVKFRNDHVAKILGYGDYQIRNVTISRVYYVEGLGHNLFFVGQFCDSNLEVAFRQHTCFIRNLEGVDLLTGSRGNNLYTLSLGDMMASSPICLLSKASKTKSWLWHRRSHLCYACAMGKSKKKPHKPKSEDTNQEKLYLLHMDLCGLCVSQVVTSPDWAWTEYVSEGVTSSYFEHKARENDH